MKLTSWLQWLKGRRGRAPLFRSARRTIPARRAFVPSLLALEGRTVPSTFTVTNLLDSGAGSLRAAVWPTTGPTGPSPWWTP
jgi:hypothetical protein